MNHLFISTDNNKLNLLYITTELQNSYWANNRSKEAIVKSLKHSLCFGVYIDDQQVGFARVVTDYSTYNYLCDFFIADEHKGNGYGKKLLETVLSYPSIASVNNWTLRTKDAQTLYQQFGFEHPQDIKRIMDKR